MNPINSRIAACIKALGIKKTVFAERINVSQAFISQLTKGVSMPSERTISDICREFNVSEPWLREGIGEMFLPVPDYAEFDFMMTQIQESDDMFVKSLIRSILKSYWGLSENEKAVIRKFVDGLKKEIAGE